MSFPSGLCSTNRKLPPTLRSTSQTAIDQPRGPNQRLSSSGLVNASKTRRRGASKTRVKTISRSVGVVTFNVPVFFIDALLLLPFGQFVSPWFLFRREGCPAARNSPPRTVDSPQAIRWPRLAVWPRAGRDAVAHLGRVKSILPAPTF